MGRWALRYLCHFAGAAALALIAEFVGMAVFRAMANLTGTPDWWRDLVGAEWRDLLVPVLRVAPMLVGLLIALPVFRILVSLAWPHWAAWRPLFWGIAGFMLVAIAVAAAMLNGHITPGQMSLILLAVLLSAGFAVTIWSQQRAARAVQAQTAPVFE